MSYFDLTVFNRIAAQQKETNDLLKKMIELLEAQNRPQHLRIPPASTLPWGTYVGDSPVALSVSTVEQSEKLPDGSFTKPQMVKQEVKYAGQSNTAAWPFPFPTNKRP